MKDKKPKIYTITPQGSLGILALGSVGIKKWREVVMEKKLPSKNTTAKDEQ